MAAIARCANIYLCLAFAAWMGSSPLRIGGVTEMKCGAALRHLSYGTYGDECVILAILQKYGVDFLFGQTNYLQRDPN